MYSFITLCSLFLVPFTAFLWSFDLKIEVYYRSKYIVVFEGLSESLEQAKKSICCLLIFIYYKKKAIPVL